MLDAEQVEVDKQLKILERRLRETSEDDQVGGLHTGWFPHLT